MRSLKPIMLLMLLPFFSMAQDPDPASIYERYVAYLSSSQKDVVKNLPDEDKLRSIYFLAGSRRDTFATQILSWSQTDSIEFLYYSTDSILLEQNHLVYDPDSGWINFQVNYYAYDEEKRDTSLLIQTWDDDLKLYNNTSKFTYAYDASSNLISSTFFNWDSTYWEKSTEILNDYDTSDNLLKTTFLNWNGSSWDSLNQFVYSYDSNNNKIQEIDYLYDGTGFLPLSKYTKTYNTANLQTQNIGQYWNGNVWKNQFQDTLEYDINNNLIFFERKDWKQSNQSYSLTDAKTEYVYNSENELIERIDYNGDGASSYTPGTNFIYDYDVNGNNTYILQKVYDAASSSFINFNQYHYYYTDFLSAIISPPNNAYVIKLYPNPTAQTLQLSMHAAHNEVLRLQVIDINGKLVSEQSCTLVTGENSWKIDVSELTAGIYHIRIYNPQTKAQSVNKFVKN